MSLKRQVLGMVHGCFWLTWYMLKTLSTMDVMLFRCAKCNLVLKEGVPDCPRCEQEIDWPKEVKK